ncbi:aldo/keto reductase [Amycolatopsis endophytica]|uniref:Aryl-alcohol dehydrogenase-like predicted oxidoreductase n=1 Tax=Amycolatopsis endophytica TaxID=860233 RepID=A0A853B4F1_9PSEU|nr:aldo/keto reductase [Amycolatopsis endophytica]NYI89702.1 aryl-alcohol dehydrogenase-like predicted oxidoreductase [Amycolatopsis endophytica]
MRKTTLGKSGLDVSRIAFGTWQLSGEWGSFDEDAAVTAVQHARELGVNFFDTAQAYGFGKSEALLGRALREELKRDRDSLVIATKGGINPGRSRPRDAGRAWLRKGVEESLRFLDLDHIDLYQVHWPDPDTPPEETASALQELVDEGKIRHAGVSNYDAAQLAAFDRTRPVETLQPPYHLFRRGIEQDPLPYCREHDIGVLVYSPLGSGLLTGALTPRTTFDADDWRAKSSAFQGANLQRNLEVVEQLKNLAAEKGATVSQLAIAWTLHQPGVHVAIVGARRAANIEDSLGAANLDLTADDLTRIADLTSHGVQIEGASPEGIA